VNEPAALVGAVSAADFFNEENMMRKTLLVLGLVAITLVASASDAFAQRGGIFGRRGGSGYYGSGYYGNSYYGNSYYGSGYYGNRYYGNGYYGNRYYGGLGSYGGFGYSPGYYSNVTPSYYYDSTPSYYSDTTVQSAQVPRTSFYNDPNAASVIVLLPAADARVWFDDAQTQQTGMERTFTTPALQPGSYNYTIRAQWTENGRTMDQSRQVRVQPGQSATVDFRRPSENLPVPKNVGG
jgi:uncharacterized protein (TIGR03000 family)